MELPLRLLFVFGIFQFARCTCPDGFELAGNGQCRGKYTTVKTAFGQAIKTAVAKCGEIRSQSVIIHTDEQQSYWKTYVKSENYFVIGLTCNFTSKQWQWADGSAVDYKPLSYDTKLNSQCVDGWTWFLNKDGKWTYGTDSGYTYYFDISCISQISKLATLSYDGCEKFDDDYENGVCYQVGTTAESWQDAQMVCRMLGANLASIHSLQENSFVRRLAVANGAVNGVYLGATISGKDVNFGWIDGTEWDYNNFYPGFPKAGFGECIAMDTSTSSGQWKNIGCSEQLPVACIRDYIKYPEQSEPTCPTETFEEGEIITSPGFPFNASTPCDFFLMVVEGKRIELEIILLEANSCCDHLIVYDGYFGEVLANLTGEVYNATYTATSSHIMQVSWQPQGGVGVLGVAMTFRGV